MASNSSTENSDIDFSIEEYLNGESDAEEHISRSYINDEAASHSSDIHETPSFYHLKILKKYFGHSSFRPMQWRIISTLLKNKRDNCAIMSTGYGKSLCYQYPAVYTGGITLVVSPLISLMEDQVLSLKAANISACLLGTAQKEKQKVLEQIFEKKFSIIYLTPELVGGEYGKELLTDMRKKLDICLIAIDEAHCISSWGHDFRVSYRHLGKIRYILPDTPILAVTATATVEVEKDIIRSLGLRNPQILHSGFDRPNLFLHIFQKNPQGPMSDFFKVVNQVNNNWKFHGPTIVYCLTRKLTETIAQLLKSKSVNCAAYHAGKGLKERKEIHEKFVKDQIDVIVATSAFGMGIDKPDIRCVIHYGTPSSIEAYYQEIGRAGRDGEPARCTLFFSDGDFNTHLMISEKSEKFNNKSKPSEEKSNKVRQFLYSTECRRSFILSYFGENYTGKNERCCDNCYAKKSSKVVNYEGIDSDGLYDFTDDAEKMLKSMMAVKGWVGMSTYLLFLRGSRGAKLKDEHKKHPLHGCGKHKSESWWKSISHILIEKQFISKKTFSMKTFTTYLYNISEAGEIFLENLETNRDSVRIKLKPQADILEQLKSKAQISVHSYSSGNAAQSTPQAILIQNVTDRNREEEIDKRLYSLMLEKRYSIADRKDCMPHNVISIPDIKELIRVKPRSVTELDKCKLEMFSEFKIHQFGQEFIDIIVEEMGSEVTNDLNSKQSIVEALLKFPLLNKCNTSTDITYNFFKQGLTIEQISEKRSMATSTIFTHLLDCMKKGLPIKLERMGVNKFARLVIVRASLECPTILLSPIKEKCPPEITWDQIRVVLTYMNIRKHLEEHQLDYEEFEDFSYNSLMSEAGSLDLDTLKNVEINKESDNFETSTVVSSDIASKRSVSKSSKEDKDLDDFLKLCSDIIQEDDLQSGKMKIKNSLPSYDNSKINRDSSSDLSNPSLNDDIFTSPQRSPKKTKIENKLQHTPNTEDDDLNNLLKVCYEMIDQDQSPTIENKAENATCSNDEVPYTPVEKSNKNAVLDVNITNVSHDYDCDVFGSPPRNEHILDLPPPHKIAKLV